MARGQRHALPPPRERRFRMSDVLTTPGPELLVRASAFEGRMPGLARLYVQAGVPVFPCHPELKRPLVPRGFRARSANPEVVERWWQRWPDALVGLVPADLGLAALDVDSMSAATAARGSGLLAATVLVVESGGTSKP